MTEQVLARIVELAEEARGVQSTDRVEGSTTIGQLDLDSLDVLKYFLAIEDEFGVDEGFLGLGDNQLYPPTVTLAEIAEKVTQALAAA